MKKYMFILTSLLLICGNVFSQAPDSIYSKTIGFDWQEYFTSVQPTTDNGFIVAGFTESLTADSSTQYWLVRLDSEADTIWSKAFSPVGEKYDIQVAYQTSDGGYIIGGDGDPWLIKTDADGNELWHQSRSTLGGPGCMIQDFEITSDGGFIGAGFDDRGTGKVLVIKTDNAGVASWVNRYGGEHDAYGSSVTETSDGGYAVAGVMQLPGGEGINNAWLLKLSSSGDSLWSVTYGDTDNAGFEAFQETADGGFIFIGDIDHWIDETTTVPNLYLLKTNSLGVIEWTKTIGGDNFYTGFAVIQTADLGYSVSAFGAADINGDLDMLIIHFAANGDSLWSVQMNELGLDAIFDLYEISDGEYIAVGGTTTDWDTGNFDGWVVRLGSKEVAIEADNSPVPLGYRLKQNYPNPFNPTTTIQYSIRKAGVIQLNIYDELGQLVRNLMKDFKSPGEFSTVWDGTNNKGELVSSGIYFYVLKADNNILQTRRMIMLK